MTVKNKLVYIYFLLFFSLVFFFCFVFWIDSNCSDCSWHRCFSIVFLLLFSSLLLLLLRKKLLTQHICHTLETSWQNRSVILIWNLFFCFFLYLFFSCCKLVDSTSYKYYLRTFVRQYSKLEMNWRGENHMRILRSENASRRRRHRPQWEARKQENVRENAFVCILLFFFNFFINN